MKIENKTRDNRRASPLLRDAEKLRELNDQLLKIAEDYIGKIPDSLEELDELLEKKYGPDLWKRIYDDIPNRNDGDKRRRKAKASAKR